jgi:predicted branched-subunit amino acid permease
LENLSAEHSIQIGATFFLALARESPSDRQQMIDLLLQLAYVALVLAVISLFICTLPGWVVVLVVVLILR